MAGIVTTPYSGEAMLDSTPSVAIATTTMLALNVTQEPESLVNASTSIFLGFYLVIAGLLGFFGNVVSVFIILKNKGIRSSCNLLFLNLAISDIILCVTMIPMSATSFFMNSWPFGYLGCEIYGFLGFICSTASMATHFSIASERFKIMKSVSVTSQLHVDYKGLSSKCVLIWIFATFWALCPIIGWSRYEFEPYKLSCTIDWYNPSNLSISFVAASGCFTFLFPLVASGAYYFRIVTMLSKCANLTPSNGLVRLGHTKRVALTGCLLITVFTIAWGPYAVISIMGSFGVFRMSSAETAVAAPILAKTSVYLNPLIYAMSQKKFRWALIELLCRVEVVDRLGGQLVGLPRPLQVGIELQDTSTPIESVGVRHSRVVSRSRSRSSRSRSRSVRVQTISDGSSVLPSRDIVSITQVENVEQARVGSDLVTDFVLEEEFC